MSLSKVFKHSSEEVLHAPFMLESLVDIDRMPAPEIVEDIGGRSLEREREAYERGFNAGEKAGFEFGRQKAEVLFNGLGGVLKELSAFRETLFKSCEKEMLDLSLAVARKVIHREVEARHDGVLECVRVALKAVAAAGEVSIRVNPKDLEVVTQHGGVLARHHGGVKGVTIEADELIDRGGCVISSNFGEVDATIGSVIHEIEEKLRDAY